MTVEHATNKVPAALASLGLPASQLARHIAWDPGALPVGRAIAEAFGADLHCASWSRLVADTNRSEDHPRVIAARTGGVRVPGNEGLTAAHKAARLERWWRPFRRDAARSVRRAVAAGGCLHLSVHSFVERLGGNERRNDIGLLFDPRRPSERAFVVALQRLLQRQGFTVRKNFPYFGHTDGHTQSLREEHAADRYLGIEIELNQRLARTVAGQRRLGRALVLALASLPQHEPSAPRPKRARSAP